MCSKDVKITRKSEPESTQNQRKTTPKKKCNKEDNSSPFVPPHIILDNNHTNTKKRVETCQFHDTTKNKSNNKGDGFSAKLWSIDLTGYNERLVKTKTDASDPSWSSLLSN